MRHLFNTRVAVEEQAGDFLNGAPQFTWAKTNIIIDPVLNVPGELMCRLDLMFVRPGKDQPMPIVAGRAPDRVGLMLFDATTEVRAGQRIRVISGPAAGSVFEVRNIPDPVQGFGPSPHHMEVQVIEVTKELAGLFPGTDPETGL